MSDEKRLTNVDQWAGKTVARAADGIGDYIGVVFTDGTYTYIDALPSYGGGAELGFLSRLPDGIAVELGLMTAEELAAKLAQDEAKRAARQTARERAEYERLKAKFEQGATA